MAPSLPWDRKHTELWSELNVIWRSWYARTGCRGVMSGQWICISGGMGQLHFHKKHAAKESQKLIRHWGNVFMHPAGSACAGAQPSTACTRDGTIKTGCQRRLKGPRNGTAPSGGKSFHAVVSGTCAQLATSLSLKSGRFILGWGVQQSVLHPLQGGVYTLILLTWNQCMAWRTW